MCIHTLQPTESACTVEFLALGETLFRIEYISRVCLTLCLGHERFVHS